MRRSKSLFTRLCIAALVSGLAALLMVTVGPGFAESPDDIGPNEHAAEQANEANAGNPATDDDVGDVASENAAEEAADASANAASDDADATAQGGPMNDPIDPGASTEPDSHGHIGAGTGTEEGSQADPGHMEDRNGTDGKTNGPGTGDAPGDIDDCGDNTDGSNADFSGSGANRHGPYDSTCDGRISQNGQGDDAPGGGTPCAGCVGKADNKQPPGQEMEFNGQKPNDMGYECDGNQGVGAHYGNGNPAHTGDCGSAPEAETYTICHVDDDGDSTILSGLTEAQRDDHLSDHDDDFEIDDAGDRERCVDDEGDLYSICHVDDDGDATVLTGLTEAEKDDHLNNHGSDFEIKGNGQSKKCEDVEGDLYSVCHVDDDGSTILTGLTEAQKDDHVNNHDDDFEIKGNGQSKKCEDVEGDLYSVCHVDDDGDYTILTGLTEAQKDDHVNNHDDDFEIKGNGQSKKCEADDRVSICHRAGNAAVILRDLPRVAADQHLNNPAHNDFIIGDDDDESLCVGGEDLFTICHVDDDDFDVVSGLTRDEADEHLDEHDFDFEIRNTTDLRACDEEDEEDEDCLGHSPPHSNHQPGDAACEDVEDLMSICHVEGDVGTILSNIDEDDAKDHLAQHTDDFIVDDDEDEAECGDEGGIIVTVCPLDSDRPMQVLPEGKTAAWCYEDVVQGEVIKNIPAPGMPQPNVKRKLIGKPDTDTRAGLLPFTGASLLAFLVLALQLIAAGSLILRGRRA